MPSDCWGGESAYNNPRCPVCGYNVISYMTNIHIRDEHSGINPWGQEMYDMV